MSNEEHYTIGSWHGRVRYRCNYCRYSETQEDRMIQHIQDRHMPKMTIKPSESGLLDKSGQRMHVVETEYPESGPIQRGQGIDYDAPSRRDSDDDQSDG